MVLEWGGGREAGAFKEGEIDDVGLDQTGPDAYAQEMGESWQEIFKKPKSSVCCNREPARF